ncbi:MAG: hypothetical protein OXG78_07060 [Chloroflexi bacterium]|nr:hypothetical protein [Chloroflexota bacterium]
MDDQEIRRATAVDELKHNNAVAGFILVNYPLEEYGLTLYLPGYETDLEVLDVMEKWIGIRRAEINAQRGLKPSRSIGGKRMSDADSLNSFVIHEDSEFYIKVNKDFHVDLPGDGIKWSEMHELMEFWKLRNIVCTSPEPEPLLGRDEALDEKSNIMSFKWTGTVLVGDRDEPRNSFEFDLQELIDRLRERFDLLAH